MNALKTYGLPVLLYVVLLALTAHYGFWWINLIIAFCLSYLMIPDRKTAFLLHFAIIFLLWTSVSILKDYQADGAVSAFLSKLAGNLPPFLLYLITGLLGGLLTGWSAYLGSYLKKIAGNDDKNS
jgi:hypothetical protein